MQLSETVPAENIPVYRFSESFPVARYRFVFTVYEPMMLPAYAGSAIRGIFGHSLKRTSCLTGIKKCRDCGLKKTCPYTGLFEHNARQEYRSGMKAAATNPYVIEAPWDNKRAYHIGDRFDFNVVLAGPALSQLALCIHAMKHAFNRGIGPAEGKAHLIEVVEQSSAQVVWSAQEQQQIKHETTIEPLSGMENKKNVCCVELQTPLRIVKQGKLLSAGSLGASEFLTAVVRRVAALVEGNMGMALDVDFCQLRQQSQMLEYKTDLRWCAWERFSNRQKQSMSAGGVTGHIELRGNLEPFLPFLKIASYVHVGKMTSFGNGKVRVVEVSTKLGNSRITTPS